MIDTRKQRMTRESTPSFPPLSEQQRMEAMAYIHKCETRKENFCNMESRIREYFVARTFNKFTHTFKEYIIYEIILYNLDFACPPRNVKEAYQARYRLFANRLECRRKWLWSHSKVSRQNSLQSNQSTHGWRRVMSFLDVLLAQACRNAAFQSRSTLDEREEMVSSLPEKMQTTRGKDESKSIRTSRFWAIDTRGTNVGI